MAHMKAELKVILMTCDPKSYDVMMTSSVIILLNAKKHIKKLTKSVRCNLVFQAKKSSLAPL
jgi:hypothetical protein